MLRSMARPFARHGALLIRDPIEAPKRVCGAALRHHLV